MFVVLNMLTMIFENFQSIDLQFQFVDFLYRKFVNFILIHPDCVNELFSLTIKIL